MKKLNPLQIVCYLLIAASVVMLIVGVSLGSMALIQIAFGIGLSCSALLAIKRSSDNVEIANNAMHCSTEPEKDETEVEENDEHEECDTTCDEECCREEDAVVETEEEFIERHKNKRG